MWNFNQNIIDFFLEPHNLRPSIVDYDYELIVGRTATRIGSKRYALYIYDNFEFYTHN